MSFPTIAQTQTSSRASNATTDTVTLPTSTAIAAGDLIIVFHFTDGAGASATVPSPWVEIKDAAMAGSTGRVFVAYLIASGGETSVVVTKAVSERFTAIAVKIAAANWHGTTPPEISTGATGTSTTPNPDSLTTSWGSADNLWIAIMGMDDSAGTNTVSAYPYASDNVKAPAVSSAGGGAICSTTSATASLDPGTFTITSDEWWAGTLAVRPAGSYTLTATQQGYVLTGNNATLKAARLIAATQQTYTMTGQVATLKAGRKITADTATYTLTGQAATLKAARLLSATVQTYSLTGQDTGLRYNRYIAAAVGSFILTGKDATLTYTPLGGYTLTTTTGTFTLTANDAGLYVSRLLVATPQSYTLTGFDAALKTARRLAADVGSFAVTGFDAGLTAARRLAAGVGSFVTTWFDAVLTHSGVSVDGIAYLDEQMPYQVHLTEAPHRIALKEYKVSENVLVELSDSLMLDERMINNVMLEEILWTT